MGQDRNGEGNGKVAHKVELKRETLNRNRSPDGSTKGLRRRALPQSRLQAIYACPERNMSQM